MCLSESLKELVRKYLKEGVQAPGLFPSSWSSITMRTIGDFQLESFMYMFRLQCILMTKENLNLGGQDTIRVKVIFVSARKHHEYLKKPHSNCRKDHE